MVLTSVRPWRHAVVAFALCLAIGGLKALRASPSYVALARVAIQPEDGSLAPIAEHTGSRAVEPFTEASRRIALPSNMRTLLST